VGYRLIRPDELEWITRPHEPGEPARHVAELSERLGFAHTRGNIWRYEPGALGRRHRHDEQEETFVVLAGELSLYVGDPPERVDVSAR
jgi:quercetin dioxygenase-like cupin family protein